MSRTIWALMLGASVVGRWAGAQTNTRSAAAPPSAESGKSTPSARAVSPRDSTRVYDAQALRFELRWGSAAIVRGADGPTVGTVGWFRNFDVEKLVESSPHAVAEARSFQTNNFRGSLVGGLGATTLAVGILVASNGSNNASSPVLIIAGAGAIGWGLQHVNRGYAALSRALWWYNRDIGRSTP
ncbi:MAG: hypothetical protein ACJ77T_05150 [Gemmatimonadaceae bacterium]